MDLLNKDLRDIYTDLLIEYAKEDDRICLVEADLMRALGTLRFQEEFPERVVDAGVAEANMISVAAGISTTGRIPFTHSFTCFAARRCFDQVTLSVCYAKNNIKMVGSDPGVMAQLNGGTHMSFEDVALMRTLPGMVVYEPVDGVQLANMFPKLLNHDGPVYIRLLRKGKPRVFAEGAEFEIGKAAKIKDGNDVTIFATGIMVEQSIEAAKILEEQGISAGVVNIHTIKPLDVDTVIEQAKKTGAVVVAENHNIINGLGSAVSEALGENYPVPVKRIGIKDHFGEVGKLDFLMEKYGLLAKDIVDAAKEAVVMKERK